MCFIFRISRSPSFASFTSWYDFRSTAGMYLFEFIGKPSRHSTDGDSTEEYSDLTSMVTSMVIIGCNIAYLVVSIRWYLMIQLVDLQNDQIQESGVHDRSERHKAARAAAKGKTRKYHYEDTAELRAILSMSRTPASQAAAKRRAGRSGVARVARSSCCYVVGTLTPQSSTA